MTKRIPVAPGTARCSTCMLGHVCLPVGLPPDESAELDEIVRERIRVPRGETLFAPGDPLRAVYGLRSGFMKIQVEDASGDVQITGFPMPGEVVGLDGMMEGRHDSRAVALEDAELCVIRMDRIDDVSARLPTLEKQVRSLLSRELSRSQRMLLALGSAPAEKRLAAFLLNLSQRLAVLGYSPNEFLMRMSRAELGNYLGMTLETVSRLFSRLAREEVIAVQQRSVRILDLQALRRKLDAEI